MSDSEVKTANIIETTTFSFLKKRVGNILLNLDFGESNNTEIPVLIGILDIYRKSHLKDWRDEAKNIFHRFPHLKKYFPSDIITK